MSDELHDCQTNPGLLGEAVPDGNVLVLVGLLFLAAGEEQGELVTDLLRLGDALQLHMVASLCPGATTG